MSQIEKRQFTWPEISPSYFPITKEEQSKVELHLLGEKVQTVFKLHQIPNDTLIESKISFEKDHIYLCYSPLTGSFYVRKKFIESEFKKIESIYQKLGGLTHCVPLLMSNGINTVIEPFYSGGDLHNKIDMQGFKSPSEKIEAIYQLSLGVTAMHALRFDDGTPFSHRDLKMDNIFIEIVEGKPKYIIGDYDLVGNAASLGAYLMCPPEWVHYTPEMASGFLQLFGQSKDIWQLGIIFVSILCNRLEEGLPPLRWIKNASSLHSFKQLSQQTIDLHLELANSNLECDPSINKIWSMVSHCMIRFQSLERYPAKLIAKTVDEIKNINN